MKSAAQHPQECCVLHPACLFSAFSVSWCRVPQPARQSPGGIGPGRLSYGTKILHPEAGNRGPLPTRPEQRPEFHIVERSLSMTEQKPEPTSPPAVRMIEVSWASRPEPGLASFEHRFETVEGVRLHYVAEGRADGDVVVLLAEFRRVDSPGARSCLCLPGPTRLSHWICPSRVTPIVRQTAMIPGAWR